MRILLLKRRLQKYVIHTALFAVLFGALSPAFAALRFQSQPQILAELCTTHGLVRVAIDGKTPAPSPVGHGEHKNIYCAWCTPASMQPSLSAPVAPAVALVGFKQVQPFSQEIVAVFSAPFFSYQSQAPPVLS